MNTTRLRLVLVACISGMSSAHGAAQHVDVLLQISVGKVVVGASDYDEGTWTIGQRVFQRQLLSNFRANDPGFTSLETENALLNPGVIGFPSNHDVSFDMLPMTNDSVVSNLFFWDGIDFDENGLSIEDVHFVIPPTGVTWNFFDDDFNIFTADGTDAFVSGGLIQQTSSDTDPFDGVDTGSLHNHLLMRVDDGDGDTQTNPSEGVYMIALQVRSEGFETSDPLLFVHRTFNVSNEVRDLAANWANANYDLLFAPPELPGDYNADGVVNAADYTVWRDTLGSTTTLIADGDGSLEIDGGDYDVWRDNFGASAESSLGATSATSVPEPASLFLLLAALFAMSHVVRRL